jgi:DNA repair protein SbcC/Rad50
MIIRRVEIGVFGGISRRSIDLGAGLNVIVGPNEAGKSTIYAAIVSGLMLASKLPKREFDRTLARYLPVGGGDSLVVALELTHHDDRYRLEKRWGDAPSSALTLPSGAVVSSDAEVQKRLFDLFPASPATVESIFLSRQTRLGATIEEYTARPEVQDDFADFLRRRVLETGGVPVERFRSKLRESVDAAFSKWDRKRQGPEGGRSGANRWKKEVGSVLGAFYRLEDLRGRLASLRDGERELEERTARIGALDVEIAELERFIETHAPAAKTATRSQALTHDAARRRVSLDSLKGDYDRWPDLERERAAVAERIAAIETSLPALREAVASAKRADAVRSISARLERIDASREAIAGLRREEEAIPPVDRETLAEIRETSSELGRLEQAARSGVITVSFAAASPTELSVSGSERITLDAGERATRRLEGAVTVEHEGLSITLRAGDEDPAAIGRGLEETGERLSALLARCGVSERADAEAAYTARERISTTISGFESRIADELSGDRYEELVAAVEAAGACDEPIEEAASKLEREEGLLVRERERLERAAAAVGDLATRYQSRDGLFRAITGEAVSLERTESELRELPGLPDGYDSFECFLEAFETARADAEKLSKERQRLALERLEIRNSLPDVSSEELEVELESAERAFRRELARGEKTAKILERTDVILAAPDDGLYTEVGERFASLLAEATDGRYRGAADWRGAPVAALRADGSAFEREQLSTGTRDLFALCFRLALGGYYVADGEGLLMLDDPLVDLDPRRQELAAKLLGAFASRVQTVLFTCHPAHADRFPEAHRIDLPAGIPDSPEHYR